MSKDFKDVLIENWIIKDENKNLITEDENKWVIENDGTLTHTGIYYPIVKEQLLDKDWIIHLMNKSWVDRSRIIVPILVACSILE